MSIGRGGVSENRLCYPLVQGRSTIEVSGHLMVISVICSEKVSERPKPEVQDFYLQGQECTVSGHSRVGLCLAASGTFSQLATIPLSVGWCHGNEQAFLATNLQIKRIENSVGH